MEVEGHKETAARLREALELFSNATNNISEIFWVTDPSRNKMIYVSPGFEKIWRRPCWALYQAPGIWLEAVHPQDRERVTQASALQISSGYDEEYRVVRPDESVCWVHDRAFPLRNEKGEIYRIVGITEDITARKRAEQLVEAQRDVGTALSLTSDLKMGLQRLLVTASKLEGIDCGGVYLMELETKAFKLEAHFGLAPDFAERVLHIGAASDEAATIKNGGLQYVVLEPEPGYADGIWKGGGVRALAIIPLKYSDAVIGALYLASRQRDDIPHQTRLVIESLATQAGGAINRIRAEDSLHRSEARLRTTITSAPIAIFATDHIGSITFQDGKELEAIGLGPGAEGRPASEVYDDYPLMLENIERAMKGEEFSSMVEFAGKVFECRFTPNRETKSKQGGYIAVAVNVTERVRLEREILEVGDREKARIGQDIHDGLCQQLVGAAFDANSLRQKLQSEARVEAALAQRIFSHLDEAITESRRLAHGLYPVRLATEGLAPALQELSHRTRERFGIRCDCETDSLRWPCDSTTATHLYRIAQEAVNNALKHSGAKRITLALRERDHAIELQITDDGKGMTDRPSPGSGMGLHIMEYRARSIGATLEILGNDPGTAVVCRLLKTTSDL
jgi:PAS domain S-box-containing protein